MRNACLEHAQLERGVSNLQLLVLVTRGAPMRHHADVSLQDPVGITGTFPCPECGRETSHSIFSIVNSHYFDESGIVQCWDHYLTVRCNGCGTISFCHESKCSEVEDYDDQGRPYLVKNRKFYPEPPGELPDKKGKFVDPIRIEEIRALLGGCFDTSKLVQMLAELNRAYDGQSFFSCAFLIRSVIDHIPPIFEMKSFPEVANHYAGGGKSFRQAMQHLENTSRKIADSFLHSQIRAAESVPTKSQIEFRADIDILLGEIVRVLRSKC